MLISPDTSTSIEKAVGASSVKFGASMTAGTYWAFASSTACWIAQGASPTASAGAGSCYVPAGVVYLLDGALGADCAVIEDSAAGKASLTRVRTF